MAFISKLKPNNNSVADNTSHSPHRKNCKTYMSKQEETQDQLIEKFITQIKEHTNYKGFFGRYSPASVNSFIKHYAVRKAVWTVNGKGFNTEMERMELMWETEAMKRLGEIQQVKLFLFQCDYRAGAIDEPTGAIRTIFDFIYWKDNVLNARFLEPITPADIRLYNEYLISPDVEHNPFIFIEDWQDFEDIRAAYTEPEETERTVPGWYLYYFNYTGRGIELTLPDIKKEKDTYYFLEGNKERGREIREAEKKALEENPKLAEEKAPYFNEYVDNNLDNFMQVFEDKENREMLKIWHAWARFNEREDMLREYLDILLYAGENVPVAENESWIDAVRLAADNYRSFKIGESLPAAYEQYKMNLDLDITFPEKENSRKNADFYNNLVLLGRKLNGEPEDFDY